MDAIRLIQLLGFIPNKLTHTQLNTNTQIVFRLMQIIMDGIVFPKCILNVFYETFVKMSFDYKKEEF